MSDFLIYAARLQDAGVCSLCVSLGSDKEGTRLMRVSPDKTTPPELAARYPTRTFELCGTDRVLERLKDGMLYSADGVTSEKVQAAIAAHPLLRDDLCAFLADYTLCPPPSTDDISDEEAEVMVSDDQVRRLGDRLKNMLRGMDIAKQRDAMPTRSVKPKKPATREGCTETKMRTEDAGPSGSELSARLGQAPERENAEERFCLQALADLRRSYDAAAKPYIDRLVAIHNMRQAPSITLTLDQAREFIDFTMGPNGA